MKTVSIDRAAEILQVSRRTIYNHIRRGYLQTIRTIGGHSQRVTLESLALMQDARPHRGERFFVAEQDAKTPAAPTSQRRAPRAAVWQVPAPPSTSPR